MKAYLQIALLAIFIIGINGDVTTCEQVAGQDEDTCRMYPTEINYSHCCYYTSDSREGCMQITDDQYETVKRFKDYMKQLSNYANFKIKCSGEYLTYSLFALLALLF